MLADDSQAEGAGKSAGEPGVSAGPGIASEPGGSSERGESADSKSAAEMWELCLYIAGQTPRSLVAFKNLRALCETHLAGKYSIQVVDLLENPSLARIDQIVAIPTLVRKLPTPVRKLVGDLSNTDRAIVGLDLARLGLE